VTSPQDPRDIPVLTEAVERRAFSAGFAAPPPPAARAAPDGLATEVSTAIVSATLKLADSLLHQAVKDIEATLFEHVFDRLRAELPELVDRILAERAGSASALANATALALAAGAVNPHSNELPAPPATPSKY
jgi:hypothetical protein